MPSVNVVLQLYKGGWREQTALVVTDNLRIEATLGSGAVESASEATRIAAAQLILYASPTTARTVAVEPAGFADTPWVSHVPGTSIVLDGNEQVVESLSFRRDDDGHIDYAAELEAHVDTPGERFELALKKMSNGTLGGTSRVAQPTSQTPEAQLVVPVAQSNCPWGFNGALTLSGIAPAGIVEGEVITGADGALYPATIVDPDAPVLPAGLVHVTGQLRIEFDGPASGEVAVAYVAPFESAGAAPADSGGRIRGLGFVDGASFLVVPFDGVMLRDGTWEPLLTVVNDTDATIDLLFATYNAFGMPCHVPLNSTTGSG